MYVWLDLALNRLSWQHCYCTPQLRSRLCAVMRSLLCFLCSALPIRCALICIASMRSLCLCWSLLILFRLSVSSLDAVLRLVVVVKRCGRLCCCWALLSVLSLFSAVALCCCSALLLRFTLSLLFATLSLCLYPVLWPLLYEGYALPKSIYYSCEVFLLMLS